MVLKRADFKGIQRLQAEPVENTSISALKDPQAPSVFFLRISTFISRIIALADPPSSHKSHFKPWQQDNHCEISELIVPVAIDGKVTESILTFLSQSNQIWMFLSMRDKRKGEILGENLGKENERRGLRTLFVNKQG